MASNEKVSELMAAELDSFRVRPLRESTAGLLVSPAKHLRDWEYGPSGQQFECWLVVRLPDGERGVVYSESGHVGPWGLVRLDDRWFGPDSCWYSRLEDAMIASGWGGELPDGYEVA